MVTCAVRSTPASGDSAISIAPAQLEIPPFDTRFVLLTFAPEAVRTYAATLDVSVDGGGSDRGFMCEVRCVPSDSPRTSNLSPACLSQVSANCMLSMTSRAA